MKAAGNNYKELLKVKKEIKKKKYYFSKLLKKIYEFIHKIEKLIKQNNLGKLELY